jgi:predicted DsbA family dithiol-disulfide isomerase
MDRIAPAGRIDIISDVICPWCYIGKRQLERALDILEKQHKQRFTVAWHPFQLNPDMPREGVDRAQYRIAKFGSLERSQQLDERITETAATVGLEFHLDRLTRTPNTLNAHRLIRFAGQKGLQDGVVEALFEGYFCNGVDIGDDKVLAKLGEEGGLDRDEVETLLSSEAGLKEVAAADRMARNAGIQGVPSFALQGHVLFSGAVPAEEMVQAFRHAWDILKNRAA